MSEATSLWLQLGEEIVEVSANGDFAFAVPVEDQATYEVVVESYPYKEYCALSDASGTIDGADVSVAVVCEPGRNQEVASYTYNTDTGELESVEWRVYDAEGDRIARLQSNAPGSDGEWMTGDDEGLQGTTYIFSEVLGGKRKTFEGRISGLGADEEPATADDVLTSYKAFEYDEKGHLTRNWEAAGSGSDGVWQTADDVLNRDVRYRYTYDSEDRLTESYRSFDAGADGVFWTADDSYAGIYREIHTINGSGELETLRISSRDAGSDNLPLTSDDPYTWVDFFRYDTSGNLVLSVRYSSPGGDSDWETVSDNRVQNFQTFEYDSQGREYRSVQLSPGPDGLAETADDTVGRYTQTLWDAEGRETQRVRWVGAGADGDWFTSDDVADTLNGTYHVSTYDAEGRRIQSLRTTSEKVAQGPDGIFGTADDDPDFVSFWVYNAEGLYTEQGAWGDPGPDGDWYTGDELYQSVTWRSFDSEGRITQSVGSTHPGPDGVWKTLDDGIAQSSNNTYYYTFREDGAVLFRAIRNSGTDGVLFTEDDTLNYESWGVVYDYNDRDWSFEAYLFDYGTDGEWGTGDDNVDYYDVYVRDRNGNQKSATAYYGSSGPDGVWYTEDDWRDSHSVDQMMPAGRAVD